jgi:hypothetical protein
MSSGMTVLLTAVTFFALLALAFAFCAFCIFDFTVRLLVYSFVTIHFMLSTHGNRV